MTDSFQTIGPFFGSFGADGKASRQTVAALGHGDGQLEEESPWIRIGLSRKRPTQSQEENQRPRRLLHWFFFVSAWLAMPLAVLTCHGWVGLLVHGLALSGAAGLLQKASLQARIGLRLQRIDGFDGEAVEGEDACASAIERL